MSKRGKRKTSKPYSEMSKVSTFDADSAKLLTNTFVGEDDIDFSLLYKPSQFQEISNRHWIGFSEYVMGSRVQIVRRGLAELEAKLPEKLAKAYLLTLYLEPHNARVWKNLKCSSPQLLPFYCHLLKMQPTEIEEIYQLGEKITHISNENEFTLIPEAKKLLKEWVIYKPAYYFWNTLLYLAPKWFQYYAPELEPVYFRARDYTSAYNPNDPFSLNIALLLIPNLPEAIEAYLGRMGPDAPNHQYLQKQMLRWLQLPVYREAFEHIAGIVGNYIGLIGYSNYTPPLPGTYDWLKMAWQFNREKDYGLLIALASTAYWEDDWKVAIPLLKRCVLDGIKNSNIAVWGSALKLAKYYGDEEKNLEESAYWAGFAQQIIPDGQAYDLLATEALINNNYEAAESSILDALNFGDHESRQDAAVSIFAQATRKRAAQLPHDEFLAVTSSQLEKISEIVTKYSDPLQEIRNTLLTLMDDQQAENTALRSDIEQLQDALKSYQQRFDESDNIPDEEEILYHLNKFIPQNKPTREKMFLFVNEYYPQALDPVKDLLVDAYLVHLVLTQINLELQDWSAPLLYIAKAVETQQRLQLMDIPNFPNINKFTLGKLINCIRDNSSLLIQHFSITEQSILLGHLQDLKDFVDKYRNGFIHKESMDRMLMDNMLEFLINRSIFRRYSLM